MANQEAVDIARRIKDPQKAAKQLVAEALNRESKDDISCIVVRFKSWNMGIAWYDKSLRDAMNFHSIPFN